MSREVYGHCWRYLSLMEIGTLSEADEAGDLFSVGKEIKRR